MKESHPMLNRYVIPDMPSADELVPYLKQLDTNRWYSNFGPLVTQFEDRLTLHLSTPEDVAKSGRIYLTTLMTCYHALQIGLQLFKMPKDAKVLVPAVTFPACPLAVKHAGAEPVLADVEAKSWQLTPPIARRIAVSTKIHAVMPVAVYGVPVDVAGWDQFIDDTGIPVIIDAASALEVQAIPKKALVAHSLHATKPFSVGEGGVLVCRRADLIDEARCISNFGTRQRISLQDGSNAKMSEYHGAVALAQLDRWNEVKKRRQVVFSKVRVAIEKAKLGFGFQDGVDRTIASTLMLQVADAHAASLVNEMNAQGIAAHRMYLPALYHHPYFADLTVANGDGKILVGSASAQEKAALMKNSEIMQQSLFGVPFHAFLADKDIATIVKALTEALPRSQMKTAAAR